MKAIEKALSMDWNFHSEGPEGGPHSIHPFPAKFIPQIPRQILKIFDVPKGTVVLDPFAGSGTALLEARLAGYDYVGIDINPIAVLVSNVKTSSLPREALTYVDRVVESARHRLRSNPDIPLPDIPRLSHWFTEENARAIVCLRDEILGLKCERVIMDFLRLGLSSITVRVSRQESETRYAAVDKNVRDEGVLDLFFRVTNSVSRKLISKNTLFSTKTGTGSIYCHDSRQIAELVLPPVSLVITSPPYPNAFEYWLYNKYRMYWLGFDPIAVREKEIGARPHYSGPRGLGVDTFVADVARCFQGISKHLTRGAQTVLIIGTQCRIRKTVFNVPELLKRALQAIGYTLEGSTERQIPRKRKVFNPEIGSIERETLLFFSWNQ
jgi:site-specific DNA-methyltransferase (cytosine-N4-specific)